ILALQAVFDHHDALRLRLEAAGEGDWQLEVAPAGAVGAAGCLPRIGIGDLDAGARGACICARARAAGSPLLAAAGGLGGAGGRWSGRVGVSVQRGAGGGGSWRSLVRELAAAWAAIARGEVPALPARGTSFRRWSQRLSSRAQDAACVGELSFWTGMLSEPS